ncbi:unnamed protein product [Allacma fusca]|uniref:Rad60/SUMO-like domain-containing protein n=1 Tax=Allacma fusca TaxID=39272 RepID=A0A8J2LCV1_9HEXA|nr:unnamed protein product [Allacma fusca]
MDLAKRAKADKKIHGSRSKCNVKTKGNSSKKRRVVDENSSSSDVPEIKGSNPSYNFSGQKSFKNIFSGVRSTLQGASDLCTDDLMYKYKDDPIMKSYFTDSSPKKSSGSSNITSRIDSIGELPSTSKSCLGGKSPPLSASTSSFSTALDVQVTPAQLAVADLDTDTELDLDECAVISVPKYKTRGRPGRGRGGRGGAKKNARTKAKISIPEIEIPSDDDPEVLEAEFTQFMTTKRNVVKPCISPTYTPLILPVDTSPGIYVPDSPLPDISFDGNMRIRIKFREKLLRFEGNERWDVELVRRKLSELTDVPESELLIYNEEDVKMVDGKTLKDYNVGEGDFLEAFRQKIEKPAHVTAAAGGITLKFQKSGLKRPVYLNVSKFKSLKDIRAILALELKVDERTLELHFDGEKVNMSNTPEDLEMEDDDCIDIHDAKI